MWKISSMDKISSCSTPDMNGENNEVINLVHPISNTP